MKKLILSIFAVFALVSCTNSTSSSISQSSQEETLTSNTSGENKILVAYFSGTGSTKRVANYINDELNSTIFEVEPEQEYTSADLNYNNASSRVVQEHNDESKQDIKLKVTTPDNFSSYTTIFVGYPIWWGIAAWPINNFIKDNDFTNKTIIPFATSVSSGLGNSATNLQQLNSTGTWLEGRRFSSSAREADVISWITSLNLK